MSNKTVGDILASLDDDLHELVARSEKSAALDTFTEALMGDDWSEATLRKIVRRLQKLSAREGDFAYIISYLFLQLVKDGWISGTVDIWRDHSADNIIEDMRVTIAGGEENQIEFLTEDKTVDGKPFSVTARFRVQDKKGRPIKSG